MVETGAYTRPTTAPLRYTIVDTEDGLAEMLQTITSAENEATLYTYIHVQKEEIQLTEYSYLLDDKEIADMQEEQLVTVTILMYPFNRAYVVDMKTLGNDAFGRCPDFSLLQLAGEEGRTDLEGRRRESLDLGQLPPLRGLLESPYITKVIFDSAHAAAAVWGNNFINMQGVVDMQLLEKMSRGLPRAVPARPADQQQPSYVVPDKSAFQRKFLNNNVAPAATGTGSAPATTTAGGPSMASPAGIHVPVTGGDTKLRELRKCLE